MAKQERHALFIVAGFIIIFVILALLFVFFRLHVLNFVALFIIFFAFLWHYIKKNFGAKR